MHGPDLTGAVCVWHRYNGVLLEARRVHRRLSNGLLVQHSSGSPLNELKIDLLSARLRLTDSQNDHPPLPSQSPYL